MKLINTRLLEMKEKKKVKGKTAMKAKNGRK
jgi:hypothetical protein